MVANAILDGIRIASPCPMNWDEMEGDDRVRFCPACSRNVYNVASMTTPEALALIGDREGSGSDSEAHPPCLRLYRRADGTTITADCPVGARASRASRLRKLVGFGIFASAFSACVAALGFVGTETNAVTTGRGTIEEWADRALIRLGLRKPSPPASTFVVGKICAPRMVAPSTTPGAPGGANTGGVEMFSADDY